MNDIRINIGDRDVLTGLTVCCTPDQSTDEKHLVLRFMVSECALEIWGVSPKQLCLLGHAIHEWGVENGALPIITAEVDSLLVAALPILRQHAPRLADQCADFVGALRETESEKEAT